MIQYKCLGIRKGELESGLYRLTHLYLSNIKFFELTCKDHLKLYMNKEYKEEDYRIVFGVVKTTFIKMVEIVTKEYNNIHKKGAEKMALHHKKE